jgi:hypothetical protein
MAPQDNEKRFEEALAGHLRRESRRNPARDDAACPDAETLAAYHERSLAPEMLNSWKEHIADCARCQEILSTVESTDQIQAGLDESEEVAAALEPVAAALPAQRSRAQRLPLQWRLLVPAGAVAAVLLVWIVVREKSVVHVPSEPSAIVAKNEAMRGDAPADAASREKSTRLDPASSPKRLEQKTLNDRRPNSTALSQEQTANDALKELSKKGGAIKGIVSGTTKQQVPALDKNSPRISDGGVAGMPVAPGQAKDSLSFDSTNGLRRRYQGQGTDAKKASTESAKKPAEQDKPTGAPVPMKVAPVLAPPAGDAEQVQVETSAAAPLLEAAPTGKQKRVAGQSAPLSNFAVNSNSGKSLPAGIKLRKMIIYGPGSDVQWNIGANGLIRRSTDGGKTWTEQTSGVPSTLVAGSAPSATVCWVVGAKGTILLTADGEHWTKMSSPTSADLVGVTAQDARHAEVWSEPLQPHYVTQDGGQTWTQKGKP